MASASSATSQSDNGNNPTAVKPPKYSFDLSTSPRPGFLGNLNCSAYGILQEFKRLYADKVVLCVDEGKSIAFSTEEETILFQIRPDTATTTTSTTAPAAVVDGSRSDGVQTVEPPATPTTIAVFTELDCFLLRFLRARAFDISKASLMLDEYLAWRVSFRVKEICEVSWNIDWIWSQQM